MRRQVCSGGAADAKCLLTVHPSHAFQRNATTVPRNASQRNAKHISRIRQLSHSYGMPCVGELCSTVPAAATPVLHTCLHIFYP